MKRKIFVFLLAAFGLSMLLLPFMAGAQSLGNVKVKSITQPFKNAHVCTDSNGKEIPCPDTAATTGDLRANAAADVLTQRKGDTTRTMLLDSIAKLKLKNDTLSLKASTSKFREDSLATMLLNTRSTYMTYQKMAGDSTMFSTALGATNTMVALSLLRDSVRAGGGISVSGTTSKTISAADASPTNELQTISVSGTSLTLSNGGGTVTLPTSTGPAGATGATGAAGNGVATITRTSGNGAAGTTDTYTITYTNGATATFTVYNGANGAVGATGPAGSYTVTAPITLTGSTLGFSGLVTYPMPNITLTETATAVAINAGNRNLVVSCTGVLAGDRVSISPQSALAGYTVCSAIATANNQITVQLYAPLLAIGASYSIPCKVSVQR